MDSLPGDATYEDESPTDMVRETGGFTVPLVACCIVLATAVGFLVGFETARHVGANHAWVPSVADWYRDSRPPTRRTVCQPTNAGTACYEVTDR